MKKAVSVLAAGVMSVSLSLPAFAAVFFPDDTSGSTTVKHQMDPAGIAEMSEKIVFRNGQSAEARPEIYAQEENRSVPAAGSVSAGTPSGKISSPVG